MPLPFGLKMPSKGTLIFSGIAGAISGIVYVSNKNADEARKRIAQKVSFLADRPCGVHEMPRKVLVYISAPPGDSIEKSRNWFREYVKPILVAGAVDYEVKEAKSAGQIESSVIEEIVKLHRETTEEKEPIKNDSVSNNPFATSAMEEIMHKKQEGNTKFDGILAIGRNAYREVLNGYSKSCDTSLKVIKEEKESNTDVKETELDELKNDLDERQTIENNNEVMLDQPQQFIVEEKENHFSLPPSFSPVMYIPHVNIIGWNNIPYRLYMWYADYKRIEEVGKHVVAVVLNNTRPIEKSDADLGQNEKKYWIGDESVKELKDNDKPIVIDERIIDKLKTYTTEDLP
ncbi:mitochondrial import inner membrane translocase subunit Tim54 [Cokeromyces recurvatus]|uniref:mitochondrial import inner membrane translocase subunit Tim54 n=1 Tax=Cokeromyces recurvatus TaxID=90255 RepID=UPI00221F7B53|nr:mitochondrial import inner membrane translocase subunit Tim54 [Cokeromyces recurvatus]KAI7899568.1 mitochondrial import inner membrane translocase subunit Tim54 [Cokeromyces recurvatus]